MLTTCKGYLLDESKGEFVAEDGRKISYHSARFYDLDSRKIVKAKVSDDSNALPEEQVHCSLTFLVNAGEKFCNLVYSGYELAK
ncbi:MAG: hypothetical protein UCH28_05505 [Adlercreutzia sp.]|nr:hypothetical protein [Adlercreutzia sp.]